SFAPVYSGGVLTLERIVPADCNKDGVVNEADELIILTLLDSGFYDRAGDLNLDSVVDEEDYQLFHRQYASTKDVAKYEITPYLTEKLFVLRERDGSLRFADRRGLVAHSDADWTVIKDLSGERFLLAGTTLGGLSLDSDIRRYVFSQPAGIVDSLRIDRILRFNGKSYELRGTGLGDLALYRTSDGASIPVRERDLLEVQQTLYTILGTELNPTLAGNGQKEKFDLDGVITIGDTDYRIRKDASGDKVLDWPVVMSRHVAEKELTYVISGENVHAIVLKLLKPEEGYVGTPVFGDEVIFLQKTEDGLVPYAVYITETGEYILDDGLNPQIVSRFDGVYTTISTPDGVTYRIDETPEGDIILTEYRKVSGASPLTIMAVPDGENIVYHSVYTTAPGEYAFDDEDGVADPVLSTFDGEKTTVTLRGVIYVIDETAEGEIILTKYYDVTGALPLDIVAVPDGTDIVYYSVYTTAPGEYAFDDEDGVADPVLSTFDGEKTTVTLYGAVYVIEETAEGEIILTVLLEESGVLPTGKVSMPTENGPEFYDVTYEDVGGEMKYVFNDGVNPAIYSEFDGTYTTVTSGDRTYIIKGTGIEDMVLSLKPAVTGQVTGDEIGVLIGIGENAIGYFRAYTTESGELLFDDGVYEPLVAEFDGTYTTVKTHRTIDLSGTEYKIIVTTGATTTTYALDDGVNPPITDLEIGGQVTIDTVTYDITGTSEDDLQLKNIRYIFISKETAKAILIENDILKVTEEVLPGVPESSVELDRNSVALGWGSEMKYYDIFLDTGLPMVDGAHTSLSPWYWDPVEQAIMSDPTMPSDATYLFKDIFLTAYESLYFDWKIDSYNDYMRFYIDEVEQTSDYYGLNAYLYGRQDYWTELRFELEPGEHTLMWVYTKDAYDEWYNKGKDRGWVDNIQIGSVFSTSFDMPSDIDSFYFDQPKWYNEFGAMRSERITHNDTTFFTKEIIAEEDSMIMFDWKTDSEQNYDYLRFYVDGVLQGRISGSTDWERASYYLSRGEHTVQWAYSKDSSESYGEDCGWVDNIALQPVATLVEAIDFETDLVVESSATDFNDNTLGGAFTTQPAWRIDNTEASQGASSFRSEKIGHNDSVAFYKDVDLTSSGQVIFDWKIDSSNDYFRFYIDGQYQSQIS
ncbi:MAG: hypothetical protein PVH45_04955, partial [Candidatus Omnitrophota bacterium]